MDQDPNRLILQIVRYGLPLTVLVFYLTASRSFEYAPESTFVHLWYAAEFLQGGGLAGPGWAGVPCPVPDWRSPISSAAMGLTIAVTMQGI